MATRVSKEFFETITKARKTKYPWSDWFSGECWCIEEGVDFQSKTLVFRANLVSKAKSLGGKVKIKIDGKKIYFQFTKGV